MLPPDYYDAALAKFPGAAFLVFSDDQPWCRDRFRMEHASFSPFVDEVEDLLAMSMCDHHIIANSSFSWWGAWLNPSPEKRVVAPREWFIGDAQNDRKTLGLMPAGWERA